MAKRFLLALGGNAILPAGKSGAIEEQQRITLETMYALVKEIGPQDQLVVTHGNGPVVGNILIRNAAAAGQIPPMPLDVCGADSQGGIGYMIAQCLGNALTQAGQTRPVTAVVTRVVVREDDPAFEKPTKPIGPFYTEADAQKNAAERGWVVREDAGRGWRRVVASPRPVEILELSGIQTLLEAGHIVIAAGGGGVPVVRKNGVEQGVEAVIDKDRASAVLATALNVETLVIVTGVSHVAIDYGKPSQRNLDRMTVSESERYLQAGEFGEGSMKPKIESALAFLRGGGNEVLIASPENLAPALAGTSGTRIVPG